MKNLILNELQYRTRLDDYFTISGAISKAMCIHTPFIVFSQSQKETKKQRIDKVLLRIKKLEKMFLDGLITEKQFDSKNKSSRLDITEIEDSVEEKSNDKVVVDIVYSMYELLVRYSGRKDVIVINQWRGQWRSDFFKFSMVELEEYLSVIKKSLADFIQ